MKTTLEKIIFETIDRPADPYKDRNNTSSNEVIFMLILIIAVLLRFYISGVTQQMLR